MVTVFFKMSLIGTDDGQSELDDEVTYTSFRPKKYCPEFCMIDGGRYLSFTNNAIYGDTGSLYHLITMTPICTMLSTLMSVLLGLVVVLSKRQRKGRKK